MTEAGVLELAKHALLVAIDVAWPLLIASLMVGTIIGIMMAATQIQEFTLTFVPKLLVMGAVLMIAGPHILRTLMSFAQAIFQQLTVLRY